MSKKWNIMQLHEFLNLGITDRFGFGNPSHFQRIPRFNANKCCISWTPTVCQALVQNVWPRLSCDLCSLPCEVHAATVLAFWGWVRPALLLPTPRSPIQSADAKRGIAIQWWTHYADGNDIRVCRKYLLIARLISTPSDKAIQKIYSKNI